jgi:hypothetical protein
MLGMEGATLTGEAAALDTSDGDVDCGAVEIHPSALIGPEFDDRPERVEVTFVDGWVSGRRSSGSCGPSAHASTLITSARQYTSVPIGIDEFTEGDVPNEPSVPEQVVSFLAVNDRQAFTRSEIATGIDADPNTVGTALSRLKDRELVRHRGNYWAITEDRDRLRSAYQLHREQAALDEEDGGIDPAEWDEFAPDEPHPSQRE